MGRGQKYLWSKKNGEEAEQEEQGNWKKETSLLITLKFTMQSTENILALAAPIEVIDASVPPAPVTLHPERSPSPAAHCQSIPDAKANFSFPNRVAAPKKMDFVAHRSKFLWRIAASEGVGVQLKFP